MSVLFSAHVSYVQFEIYSTNDCVHLIYMFVCFWCCDIGLKFNI